MDHKKTISQVWSPSMNSGLEMEQAYSGRSKHIGHEVNHEGGGVAGIVVASLV